MPSLVMPGLVMPRLVMPNIRGSPAGSDLGGSAAEGDEEAGQEGGDRAHQLGGGRPQHHSPQGPDRQRQRQLHW